MKLARVSELKLNAIFLSSLTAGKMVKVSLDYYLKYFYCDPSELDRIAPDAGFVLYHKEGFIECCDYPPARLLVYPPARLGIGTGVGIVEDMRECGASATDTAG